MKHLATGTLLYASIAFGGPPALPDCTYMTPAACNAATKEWGRLIDEYYAQMPARPIGWISECEQDRVTLEKKCTLSDGKLQVFHTKQLGICFSGPNNSFPGKNAVVRIGNFDPIHYEGTVVCGKKAVDIAARLMTEQAGAARGYRWPSGIDEFEFNPVGFKAALDEFERLVEANP